MDSGDLNCLKFRKMNWLGDCQGGESDGIILEDIIRVDSNWKGGGMKDVA